MPYLTNEQLKERGFKSLGINVRISDKASIYDCEKIEIGDHSRIDDFCVISGKVKVGRNVHITPQCLVSGGKCGLIIDDFCALAYGVKVFTQSDDYSGSTMTNSTVSSRYKQEKIQPVFIGKHSIIGAGSIVMPGVIIREGGAVGANSLVLSDTECWSIYAGTPAKKIKNRKKELLVLEQQFLSEGK